MGAPSSDTVDTPPAASRRRRRVLKHWGPFGLVAAICLVLFFVDGQLKRTDKAGIAPQAPNWQIVAPDLPALWAHWEVHPAYGAFEEQAATFMQDFSAAVRMATGVRPIPARLRLWLGQSAVLAGNGTDWCFSVRPGVALRAASLVHSLGAESPVPSVRMWGELAYGWRDGFLLVSPSTDFLATALESGETVPVSDASSASIDAQWTGPQPGSLQVEASEGLPFALELAGVGGGADQALHFSESIPDAAVVVNGHDPAIAWALTSALEAIARPLLPVETMAAWDTLPPAWWNAHLPPLPPMACAGEQILAVFEPEERRDSALPHVAWRQAACSDQALDAMGALDDARPYQWNDLRGWLVATPRHAASWYGAQAGDHVALASSAALVPRMLEATPGASRPGALQVRAQWRPVARWARNGLKSLAEGGLLPGYSAADIQESWVPYLDALGAWQSFEAAGETGEKALRITGKLAVMEAPT